MDYYTTIRRSMFRRINEVGAKPFLLFQYYLTYATAGRINPSSKTTATDLGILDKNGNPQISAISHLKKILIEAGWIEETKDGILITLAEPKVEKISTKLEKISTNELRKSQVVVEKISTQGLENLNSPYIRNENKEERTKRENKKEKNIKKESLVKSSRIPEDFEVTPEMIVWVKARAPDVSVSIETELFKNYWKAKAGKQAEKLDWKATWQNWMLNQQKWTEERNGNKQNGTNQPSNQKYQDAGSRNAERIRNSNAFIEQLLREGEAEQRAEQGLSG